MAVIQFEIVCLPHSAFSFVWWQSMLSYMLFSMYVFQYRNFDEDQAGMKKQLSQLSTLLSAAEPQLSSYLDQKESGNLFFCFRWLLVWFKREFSHQDIMTLWEVIFKFYLRVRFVASVTSVTKLSLLQPYIALF